MEFDYTDYSWSSVKLFLDCLHLIPAGPTDIITLIECIDLAQFEGKTTYDSFEVDLVERLMDSVMKTNLQLGTELLVAAYLHEVDNLSDDRYQKKVARKLAEVTASFLVFAKFDIESPLNKRLIEMCVKKRIFTDGSRKSVLDTLLVYARELYDFAVENLDVDSGFRPNPQSVR